jgi:hypothetical protein
MQRYWNEAVLGSFRAGEIQAPGLWTTDQQNSRFRPGKKGNIDIFRLIG